jgi:hypothetical protein
MRRSRCCARSWTWASSRSSPTWTPYGGFCLSVCLSVCPSGCLSVWLSGWLAGWLRAVLHRRGHRWVGCVCLCVVCLSGWLACIIHFSAGFGISAADAMGCPVRIRNPMPFFERFPDADAFCSIDGRVSRRHQRPQRPSLFPSPSRFLFEPLECFSKFKEIS